MRKYVVYTRVSTQEQKKSGLGLEAQVRDIEIFLSSYSEVPWEVIGEFQDTGSGADNDRPEFQKALALVRSTGAELLVSKLDRLSRRVSVISLLLEDKRVRFRVASMPNADTFQLHIYASLAEQEREFISLRTKAALAAAKARGVKLGGDRGSRSLDARNAARQVKAAQYLQRVGPMVAALASRGKSLTSIASELVKLGVQRPQGGDWNELAVKRLLKKVAADEASQAGSEAA